MRTMKESDKLSLSECKKILGKEYSDDEILKIRNWLYRFTEITMNYLETKTKDELTELKKRFKKIEQ